MLLDKLDDVLVYLLGFRPYFVVKIGAVERAFEFPGISYSQIFLYVRSHLVCGCGRKSDYGCRSYLCDYRSYPPVLGAEIVSPLRYAVCLVYGVKRYLDGFQKLHVVLFCQRFRRHVQQFGASCFHVGFHPVCRRLVERGVQVVCYSARLAYVGDDVNLIFHKRYQRRYHYCRPFHQKRRQLVAQRLAAACRHQHERVVAGEHIAYDRFLIALELVEAEIFFEGFREVHFVCHRLWLGFRLLVTSAQM